MRLKQLEQWWRRLWIKLLVRLMRRAGDGRPNWDARPMRVLFLRHDRAGDMIVSTGVMRSIARSHGTISLDVLASPANAALIENADYVANLIVFDKKKLAGYLPTAIRLRRARYDAVIDCMVTAPSVTTLLLILASGARYRVGIAGRGTDVNISAGTSERLWPEAHYAAVMRHIATLSPGVVLRVIASPSDAARAERIARNGGGVFVPTRSMRDAIALVATADFVFTPDTSIAHAASAFQRPAVAIYAKGKRASWALYGTRGVSVEHTAAELEGLPAERVLDAVDEVWTDAVVSRPG
jgi:ADP-heptose:LPS heptosyltransferase